ncbi:EAL domain-containing protein [Vibrio sp. Of7-15]|nr:GGDEF and EAL domain-containing protein [Vibrio sp. Of7-15]MCG7496757.1 EAL domain-containing protein [Vibrio sp. Of7-15]
MLPFSLVLLLTIGVIAFIQSTSYEKMVKEVSHKLLAAFTKNVSNDLKLFLDEPFKANLTLSDTIQRYQLYQPHDLSQLDPYFEGSLTNLYHDLEQMNVIGFGGINGEFIGFRRETNQGLSLMLQDSRTDNNLIIYRGKEISDDIRSVIENYDPRVRPWYTPAAETLKPSWSPIYANADERKETTLSAINPVLKNNQLLGVVVTDVKLNNFNKFLIQEKELTTGSIYIIDPEQRLVAHSDLGSVVSLGTPNSPRGSRLLANESPNPVIRQSAKEVGSLNLEALAQAHSFVFNTDDDRYFNQVTRYQDRYGLEWYIVVSISEGDLLGYLPQQQQTGLFLGLIIGVIGLVVGLIVINRIIQPIFTTANAAKSLASGDWKYAIQDKGTIYETSMLMDAFSDMTQKLQSSFQALRDQILYDSLTQLHSRQGLIEAVNIDASTTQHRGLILIGVKAFRDVNDSLGHLHGDQLLIAIAQRLRHHFSQQVILARVSGDEFAIYLHTVHDTSDMLQKAQELHAMFNTPFTTQGEEVLLKVSIGTMEGNLATSSISEWLRNASIALSQAKHSPQGIVLYHPDMALASEMKTRLTTELGYAIDNQEFVPFYQPVINLETGQIKGAEALIRWFSPQRGMVSPADFIPIAEDNGMIIDIGRFILNQACKDTAQRIQKGEWAPDFHINVNLSVCQLTRDNFIDELKHTLTTTQLPAKNLTLEITESRLVNHDSHTIKTIKKIRRLGVRIAIDDFGTGYSSLAYLHQLPFDCLKIDRSFVAPLTKETLETSVIVAIINMTKGFNIDIVAEGVETAEQAQLLASLGCPSAQGYLYSRPVPIEEWPTDLVNVSS